MLGFIVVSVKSLALQGGQVNSLILGDRMRSIDDILLHLSVHQVHLHGVILIQVGIFEKEPFPVQQIGGGGLENREILREDTKIGWVDEYVYVHGRTPLTCTYTHTYAHYILYTYYTSIHTVTKHNYCVHISMYIYVYQVSGVLI